MYSYRHKYIYVSEWLFSVHKEMIMAIETAISMIVGR